MHEGRRGVIGAMLTMREHERRCRATTELHHVPGHDHQRPVVGTRANTNPAIVAGRQENLGTLVR